MTFSFAGVCAERFLSVSRGHGVFPLFSRVGFPLPVDVGYGGSASVYRNIMFFVDRSV